MAVPTSFALALNEVAPSASGARLVELFQGKADRTTIIHWKAGRYSVPRWALDRLRQIRAEANERFESLIIEAEQKETGPGRKAGTMNIRKWNATNPR